MPCTILRSNIAIVISFMRAANIMNQTANIEEVRPVFRLYLCGVKKQLQLVEL